MKGKERTVVMLTCALIIAAFGLFTTLYTSDDADADSNIEVRYDENGHEYLIDRNYPVIGMDDVPAPYNAAVGGITQVNTATVSPTEGQNMVLGKSNVDVRIVVSGTTFEFQMYINKYGSSSTYIKTWMEYGSGIANRVSTEIYQYNDEQWVSFGGTTGIGNNDTIWHAALSEGLSGANVGTVTFKLTVTPTYKYVTIINYDYNGGTGSPASKTITNTYSSNSTRQTTFSLPSNPTPASSSYEFSHWTIDHGGTINSSANTATVTEGYEGVYTVTANWIESKLVATFVNGSTTVSTIDISKGQPLNNYLNTVPNPVPEDNMFFVGWYKDGLYDEDNPSENRATSEYVMTADTTFEAVFMPVLEFTSKPTEGTIITSVVSSLPIGSGLTGKNISLKYQYDSMDFTNIAWSIVDADQNPVELTEMQQGGESFIIYLDPGTYTVSVKVTNSFGTTDVVGQPLVVTQTEVDDSSSTSDNNDDDSKDSKSNNLALGIIVASIVIVIIGTVVLLRRLI